MPRRPTILAATALLTLAGCGGDGGPDLPPEAAAGRDVVRSNGCASCHGANGQGGVGPSFEGLYGSEVELENGSTVVADREYLRESILDPKAKIVEGYSLPMPAADLGEAEVDQIITFIAALGVDGAT